MAKSLYPNLHGVNTYPIPSPIPANAQNPGNVLYLNVWYNQSDMSWNYLPDSGLYPLTGGIRSFTKLVKNNALDTQDRISVLPAPTTIGDTTEVIPIILEPCYVLFVVQQNTPGFKFPPAANPVGITTSCGDATEYYYSKFVHDDDTDPNSPVHMIYFRVNSPATDTLDGFNLNLLDGVVDPDIKNTGRPPAHAA